MKKPRSAYFVSIELVKRVFTVYKSNGIKFVIENFVKRFFGITLQALYNNRYKLQHNEKDHGNFIFQNKKIAYFSHPYGYTNENERAIEIALIKHLVDLSKVKNSLEVGNVLSHYGVVCSEIIDKYESGENLKNIDVIDIDVSRKFETIISISTLEHVGLDEIHKDKNKCIKAVNILVESLKNGGQLIATIPINYNKTLQNYLINEFPGKKYFFQKINSDNCWVECSQKQALSRTYGFPYICANALLLLIYKKI